MQFKPRSVRQQDSDDAIAFRDLHRFDDAVKRPAKQGGHIRFWPPRIRLSEDKHETWLRREPDAERIPVIRREVERKLVRPVGVRIEETRSTEVDVPFAGEGGERVVVTYQVES